MAFAVIGNKRKIFPGVWAYVNWMLRIIAHLERTGVYKEESGAESKMKTLASQKRFLIRAGPKRERSVNLARAY
jgi:hypothetical protein